MHNLSFGLCVLDFPRFGQRWRQALEARERVLQAVREEPSCHYLAQRATELWARLLVSRHDSPSRFRAPGSTLPKFGVLPLQLGRGTWRRGGRALGGDRGPRSRGTGHGGGVPKRYPGTGLWGPEKPMGVRTLKDVWRELWGNRTPLDIGFLGSRPGHTAPEWDAVRLCSQGTKDLRRGRRGMQTDGDRDLKREKE